MVRSRSTKGLILLACVLLLFAASGCLGGFNLTRTMNEFNHEVSGHKWTREGIFIAMLSVYGVAVVLDVAVFNASEFWSGENLLKDPK